MNTTRNLTLSVATIFYWQPAAAGASDRTFRGWNWGWRRRCRRGAYGAAQRQEPSLVARLGRRLAA